MTPTIVPELDKKRNEKIDTQETEVQESRYVFLEKMGLTELKVARKFMNLPQQKGNWIYNKTRKSWMYWNESRNIWMEDTESKMFKDIAEYAESISAQFTKSEKIGDENWKQFEKVIVRFQSASGLKNIAHCCMTEATIINENDLDSNPYLINLLNGIYNLKTNTFFPTNPRNRSAYMTKQCKVDYDQSEKCPLWEKTLNDIFMGNESYIDYIQRILGYLLAGENRENIVAVIHGGGRNGKGTIFDVIQKILGSYFYQVPQNGFTTKGKDNPLIIADLYGKRFALLSETDRGAELATSLLKSISGGDTVSGRRHHELYFQYKPTYKVFIETNHPPAIYDDPAMWERLHTIKFERYFKPEERDKNLKAKLLKESAGILQWLLEGWIKYQERGLVKPEEAIKHTEEHREEFDTLGHFFNDRIAFTDNEDDFILPSKLYDIYSEWISRNKLKGMNGIQFGKEIRKRKEITYKESKRITLNGKPTVRSCYIKLKEI